MTALPAAEKMAIELDKVLASIKLLDTLADLVCRGDSRQAMYQFFDGQRALERARNLLLDAIELKRRSGGREPSTL